MVAEVMCADIDSDQEQKYTMDIDEDETNFWYVLVIRNFQKEELRIGIVWKYNKSLN